MVKASKMVGDCILFAYLMFDVHQALEPTDTGPDMLLLCCATGQSDPEFSLHLWPAVLDCTSRAGRTMFPKTAASGGGAFLWYPLNRRHVVAAVWPFPKEGGFAKPPPPPESCELIQTAGSLNVPVTLMVWIGLAS